MRDIGRFVIGDAGYRAIYGGLDRAGGIVRLVQPVTAATRVQPAGPDVGAGARTLLREAGGSLALTIYYPDSLVSTLERHHPARCLDERNVDAFSVLVEELDHFLTIAERFLRGGELSLLDLELHANVTKYLVVKHFIGGIRGARRLPPADNSWIQYHLFEKPEFAEPDPEVCARYRDAARLASRYVRALDRMSPVDRPAELRRFHRLSPQAKIARIETLAV